MSIKEQVMDAVKLAMKSGDKERLGTLRMLTSALKDFEINNRDKALTDAESIAIFRKNIKSRRDAIAQFESGGRPDLAAKEAIEIEVIESFLPAVVSDDEVRAAVDAAIAETGATTVQQMGLVMKAVLGKLAGRADGTTVNKFVRERLAANAPRA